jgi:hypothetical protein
MLCLVITGLGAYELRVMDEKALWCDRVLEAELCRIGARGKEGVVASKPM